MVEPLARTCSKIACGASGAFPSRGRRISLEHGPGGHKPNAERAQSGFVPCGVLGPGGSVAMKNLFFWVLPCGAVFGWFTESGDLESSSILEFGLVI